MNVTTTSASPATRKVFSRALLVYLILWLAGFVFVSRVFGVSPAIGLSLILAFPFVIGVRMRSRWQALRRREFVFLFTLLIFAFGAVGGLVWNWYDTGIDHRHAEDVKCAEFARLLRGDPAFRNVEIFALRKQVVRMHGTVASQADLDRLRLLAAQYQICWFEEIEVK